MAKLLMRHDTHNACLKVQNHDGATAEVFQRQVRRRVDIADCLKEAAAKAGASATVTVTEPEPEPEQQQQQQQQQRSQQWRQPEQHGSDSATTSASRSSTTQFDPVQQDPFIAAELARGRLRQGQAALAQEGLTAMRQHAAKGTPAMCIAAATAGRDDIVNIALQYFATATAAAAAPTVCAEMFAAALSVRPGAQIEIAELLLLLQAGAEGAVPSSGALPLKCVEIAVVQRTGDGQ